MADDVFSFSSRQKGTQILSRPHNCICSIFDENSGNNVAASHDVLVNIIKLTRKSVPATPTLMVDSTRCYLKDDDDGHFFFVVIWERKEFHH